MINKKVIKSIALAGVLAVSLLTGCTNTGDKKIIKVGITQIVEHPSLDAAKKGFIDALGESGYKEGENLEIDMQNAQGDMATAQTIAQSFTSGDKDMIFAISTPSAQAAYNTIKDKPILITAVTDPVKAGLAKSLEKPDTNITGTTDAAPIEKQFELLKKLMPNAKKVGIIYNTSEVNSESEIQRAKKVAPEYGLEVVTAGVTNVNEISQVLDSMIKNIDVLYTPADNVVASSMPLISQKCMGNKVPIIGAVKAEVESGALATEGIDYYKLGYQTGKMAVEVIKGKSTKEMPITTLKDTELVINMETAKKLNISIPVELQKTATIVKGGDKQ